MDSIESTQNNQDSTFLYFDIISRNTENQTDSESENQSDEETSFLEYNQFLKSGQKSEDRRNKKLISQILDPQTQPVYSLSEQDLQQNFYFIEDISEEEIKSQANIFLYKSQDLTNLLRNTDLNIESLIIISQILIKNKNLYENSEQIITNNKYLHDIKLLFKKNKYKKLMKYYQKLIYNQRDTFPIQQKLTLLKILISSSSKLLEKFVIRTHQIDINHEKIDKLTQFFYFNLQEYYHIIHIFSLLEKLYQNIHQFYKIQKNNLQNKEEEKLIQIIIQSTINVDIEQNSSLFFQFAIEGLQRSYFFNKKINQKEPQIFYLKKMKKLIEQLAPEVNQDNCKINHLIAQYFQIQGNIYLENDQKYQGIQLYDKSIEFYGKTLSYYIQKLEKQRKIHHSDQQSQQKNTRIIKKKLNKMLSRFVLLLDQYSQTQEQLHNFSKAIETAKFGCWLSKQFDLKSESEITHQIIQERNQRLQYKYEHYLKVTGEINAVLKLAYPHIEEKFQKKKQKILDKQKSEAVKYFEDNLNPVDMDINKRLYKKFDYKQLNENQYIIQKQNQQQISQPYLSIDTQANQNNKNYCLGYKQNSIDFSALAEDSKQVKEFLKINQIESQNEIPLKQQKQSIQEQSSQPNQNIKFKAYNTAGTSEIDDATTQMTLNDKNNEDYFFFISDDKNKDILLDGVEKQVSLKIQNMQKREKKLQGLNSQFSSQSSQFNSGSQNKQKIMDQDEFLQKNKQKNFYLINPQQNQKSHNKQKSGVISNSEFYIDSYNQFTKQKIQEKKIQNQLEIKEKRQSYKQKYELMQQFQKIHTENKQKKQFISPRLNLKSKNKTQNKKLRRNQTDTDLNITQLLDSNYLNNNNNDNDNFNNGSLIHINQEKKNRNNIQKAKLNQNDSQDSSSSEESQLHKNQFNELAFDENYEPIDYKPSKIQISQRAQRKYKINPHLEIINDIKEEWTKNWSTNFRFRHLKIKERQQDVQFVKENPLDKMNKYEKIKHFFNKEFEPLNLDKEMEQQIFDIMLKDETNLTLKQQYLPKYYKFINLMKEEVFDKKEFKFSQSMVDFKKQTQFNKTSPRFVDFTSDFQGPPKLHQYFVSKEQQFTEFNKDLQKVQSQLFLEKKGKKYQETQKAIKKLELEQELKKQQNPQQRMKNIIFKNKSVFNFSTIKNLQNVASPKENSEQRIIENMEKSDLIKQSQQSKKLINSNNSQKQFYNEEQKNNLNSRKNVNFISNSIPQRKSTKISSNLFSKVLDFKKPLNPIYEDEQEKHNKFKQTLIKSQEGIRQHILWNEKEKDQEFSQSRKQIREIQSQTNIQEYNREKIAEKILREQEKQDQQGKIKIENQQSSIKEESKTIIQKSPQKYKNEKKSKTPEKVQFMPEKFYKSQQNPQFYIKDLNSKKLNEIIQYAKDKEKEIEIKKTDLRECIKEWQGSNKLANTTYGQYLQVKVQKGHANLEEMVYLAMIKKQKQKNKQNNSAFNTLYSSTNHNNQKLSFIQKNAYPRLANYN